MIIIFLVTTYILLYYRVLERKIKKKSPQCSQQTHGCGFLAPFLMESYQWTEHIRA